MKRIIIILSLISIFSQAYSLENSTKLIKRTVVIFPFINKNKVEKYDYLKDALFNALTSDLIQTETFNFVNQLKYNQLLLKKDGAEYLDNNNAKNIALNLNADVIVTGEFIIIEDKILIQIKAVDVFSERIAASTNIKGELGTDLFRIIEDASKDISAKMSKELKKVDKSYFDEMRKLLIQKKNMEFVSSLSPVNKTGIALTATGTFLILAGIPMLIYDLAGYTLVLDEKKNQYEKKMISFDDYYAGYQVFIGLFISSVVISSLGLIITVTGIPLVVYKSKSVNVSLNYRLSASHDLFIGFSF